MNSLGGREAHLETLEEVKSRECHGRVETGMLLMPILER